MNITVPRKRNGQEGFTLVELMIVVAIIGILAVLAVFGVSKYLENAKTGEARNSLGMVAKASVGAYEQERADAKLLAAGGSTATNVHQFCETATATVPSDATAVAGKKYQSSMAADWNNAGDSSSKGWKCLKFSITEPQYFQYGYYAENSADGKTGGFNGYATGYLHGTDASHGFSLGGKLTGAAPNIQVVVQPQIMEDDGKGPTTSAALPPS